MPADRDRADRVRRAADAATRFAASAQLAEHARAREAGLSLHSVDATVLALLRVHGPLTPRELARRARIGSSGTITGAIDRLERAGWTTRTPCRADRRKVFVELTEAASAAGPGSGADDALARCSDAELTAVADVLERAGLRPSADPARPASPPDQQ